MDERSPYPLLVGVDSHRAVLGNFDVPGQRRNSLLVRAALLVALALSLTATVAMWFASAGPWALVCGVPAVVLGLGLVAAALIRRKLVIVTVYGRSMEPTHYPGDRVLVRRGMTPTVGQLVVIEQPTADPSRQAAPAPDPTRSVTRREWLLKRVAATPGDPVPRDRVPALVDVPEDRVPPGKLVLLGDNVKFSLDSRRIGYFAAELVLGTVIRPLPR